MLKIKVKPLSRNQLYRLLEKHKYYLGIRKGIMLAHAEAGGEVFVW